MTRKPPTRVTCHVCGRSVERKKRHGVYVIGPHYLVNENGHRELCLGTDQSPQPTTMEAREFMRAPLR